VYDLICISVGKLLDTWTEWHSTG